jgi:hypothetical protein
VGESLGKEHFALLHFALGCPDCAHKQGPDAIGRHSSRECAELLLHLLQRELRYIAEHAPEKQQHALLILIFVARFEEEEEELRRAAKESKAEGQEGSKRCCRLDWAAQRTSPQRMKEERMEKARAS